MISVLGFTPESFLFLARLPMADREAIASFNGAFSSKLWKKTYNVTA